MRRWRSASLAALLLAAGLPSPSRAAESLQLVEQQIQAGLLYNFLKATKWPAGVEGGPEAPIAVCLFGGDPFDGRLGPMAGRTVNQRAIEIRNIRTADETRGCALVVVHPAEKARWPQLRGALAGRAVLTVGPYEGFAESGGMIEFARIDQRIGMRLNADAIAAAHLQVEDRLMRLAMIVRGGTGGN